MDSYAVCPAIGFRLPLPPPFTPPPLELVPELPFIDPVSVLLVSLEVAF